MRYDRTRFLLFGLLPAINALGLALYALGLATRGAYVGAERPVPAILVIAAAILVLATVATVRRGRDLGLPAALSVLIFWLTLGLGPVFLLTVGAYSFIRAQKSADRYGPPCPPATVLTGVWTIVNLVWPWALLAVLGRML